METSLAFGRIYDFGRSDERHFGQLVRGYWAGMPGSAVGVLTINASYLNSPISTGFLTSFNAPRNVGET